MISAPSSEDHPAILADWLELQAVCSTNNQSRILALSDIRDITQDEEAEDIGDFDAGNDAVVARVTTEIMLRKEFLKTSYPFEVGANGHMLSLRPFDDIGASVYLACLFMSHVSQSALLEKFDLKVNARSGRNIFQICAALAASGWCDGPAVSFGWPRRDQSGFSTKLAETYRLFGDGTPRAAPLAGAPQHIKDGGIDVIAWRSTHDNLPGTLYLLGQVASGNNWKTKSVLGDISLFHYNWFEVQPSSMPQGAMFVPFCFTDAEESGQFQEQEVRVSKMQMVTKEFGIFIYRYRLPHYAKKAEALHMSGITPIEGLAGVADLKAWVQEFIETLKVGV